MSAFTPIVASAPLAEAMGEELLLASRMLADLAYELGSDATTLRKHMTGLQKIDHITQIQLAIVDLACAIVSNQCSFKHSSRNLPLKLSM